MFPKMADRQRTHCGVVDLENKSLGKGFHLSMVGVFVGRKVKSISWLPVGECNNNNDRGAAFHQ